MNMRLGWTIAALLLAAQAQSSPRERLSINSAWRFTHGDPAGTTPALMYDIRPALVSSEDGQAAERTQEAQQRGAATQPILKPWIMPSGNAFIKDPAKRYQRPAAEPLVTADYARADFNDSAWQAVTLPHDWAIGGPFLAEGPYGGMGRLKTWDPVWYRRTLDIPAADKGKSIFLDVDGAMSYAMVWLNGKLVGGWPYGYASWRLDLTPYLVPGGKNQLAIRLDNPPESARWYPGAGIYRNVWLVKTHPVHVGQWGTFIKTPQVSAAAATVDLKVAVDNDSATAAAVDIASDIYALDEQDHIAGAAVASFPAQQATIAGKSNTLVKASATVAKPLLWGPSPQQKPNRYVAVTRVTSGGKLVDEYRTPFGIRTIVYDAKQGILVNGQRIPLNGTNNHHDLGALGAAFNVRAAQRQLEMLREMGSNALRMSHNQPAPELLELADKMGFLVVDEIHDTWVARKAQLDFHLIFPDWHEQDTRAFIRRDRNHPSVIYWSFGNEVGEQYNGDTGVRVAKTLADIVHDEDATRPTMTAMNFAGPDSGFAAVPDAISVNYQGAGIRSKPGLFPAFRAKFPDKVIFSSESAAAVSTRGDYQFPVPGSNSEPVRPGVGGDWSTHQVSAYELFASDFGTSADRAWSAQDQNPFVAGEFVWTGWDYLGEPSPFYSSRSSYYGIIDLAGFKKDRFYLYQSRWRPDLPMAHILPHWTWPERQGQFTPVHVFTSGDEAELFINGKSQGRRKKAIYEYRLRWDYTIYEPGEVSVVAYKDGKEWARDTVKTADAPAALEAKADRARIDADGRDLSFVTIRVLDQQGVTAPRANNRIRFSIDGPGEIVATDNGDATNFDSFLATERPAFHGLCLVIVRAKPGQSGKITVHATSPSIKEATVTLQAGAKP